MSRRDRVGLALLAGGIGLALANLATWALGLETAAWRLSLSGVLMVAGLATLALGVVRGVRGEE